MQVFSANLCILSRYSPKIYLKKNHKRKITPPISHHQLYLNLQQISQTLLVNPFDPKWQSHDLVLLVAHAVVIVYLQHHSVFAH